VSLVYGFTHAELWVSLTVCHFFFKGGVGVGSALRVWAQAEEEVCKEANRYEQTKDGIGLQPVGQAVGNKRRVNYGRKTGLQRYVSK
jgi:hypothetical protein